MALLHLVNKSPFTHQTLNAALMHALPGSGVLLLEDGVYAALDQTSHSHLISDKLAQLQCYALLPDLQARGLPQDKLIAGIRCVDYAGFVDLVEQFTATQSWL